MARISFLMIVVKSTVIVSVLLISDNRKEVADALATATPLLGTLLGVYTTIIAAYFGASTAEKIFKK